MTNPTLERAARAAREYMESVNADEHTADVLTLGVARAVLMAVRTLDQSSINAAIDAGYEASGFHDIFHFPTAFRTAIDEVLKDG